MFRNRVDAATRLAARCRELELHDPIVLGIPRGGVAIAAVIAREIGGELDVVLSRKLRAPHQPELAIGAVSENGDVHLTPEGRHVPGVSDAYINEERERELAEIRRRRGVIQHIRPAANLRGRSVIMTDDGVATGSTLIAALTAARMQQPKELIVAVPVAPPGFAASVENLCDRVIVLDSPELFFAISQCYDEFEQVDDEEVVRVLTESARSRRVPAKSGK